MTLPGSGTWVRYLTRLRTTVRNHRGIQGRRQRSPRSRLLVFDSRPLIDSAVHAWFAAVRMFARRRFELEAGTLGRGSVRACIIDSGWLGP